MSLKLNHKILIIGLTIGASACASTAADQTHSDTFGQAVNANKAAHFVAPTQAQKSYTFIPADRTRRDKARKRYREDDVEKPVILQTNN